MSLTARNVAVKFGGVVALDDVGVSVEPGMIQGVIGPNGSGKSTLFNCLTGFVSPSHGTVTMNGDDITTVPIHQRIGRGLARTFQTPRFDPAATVWHTVACGFYPTANKGLFASMVWTPAVRARERDVADGVETLLRDFQLLDVADEPIGGLSLGRVRLVEVARSMAMSPKYILLDEPAAGLAKGEQTLLASELQRLAAAGIGVLIVEHNFDLVMSLCDRVLVLNRGRVLVEGDGPTIANDQDVKSIYLGVEESTEAEEVAP